MRLGLATPPGVPRTRTDEDAPAPPSAAGPRWSETHAARDPILRGRADVVPRDLVSGVLAGQTSPGCAWKDPGPARPAVAKVAPGEKIPVSKAALAGRKTWLDRRGAAASSVRQVRQSRQVIRATFGTGIVQVRSNRCRVSISRPACVNSAESWRLSPNQQ
ncbi:hypothetical protein MASR1M32_20930 [Rhodobacter sp.]